MGQSAPSVDWRGPTYERFTQVTEIPLLLLAVALIPILVIPEVSHVHHGEKNILDAIDYGIWAVFLCEYVVRLVLARRRLAFIRHNVPDLVLVALPMLRPLRVLRSARALRLLRLGRLAAALRLGTRLSERSLQASAVGYAIVVALALTAACLVWSPPRSLRSS
jgi:voltage-gated potassium channel